LAGIALLPLFELTKTQKRLLKNNANFDEKLSAGHHIFRGILKDSLFYPAVLKILEKNIPPALGNMTPDLET